MAPAWRHNEHSTELKAQTSLAIWASDGFYPTAKSGINVLDGVVGPDYQAELDYFSTVEGR